MKQNVKTFLTGCTSLLLIGIFLATLSRDSRGTVTIPLQIPKLEPILIIKSEHFKNYVVIPTLELLADYDERLNTQASVELMMGTAAQESHIGYWLNQMNGGPGRGIYSIEPDTSEDIWRYLMREDKSDLKQVVSELAAGDSDLESQLTTNLMYATALARIKFWMIPEPIPEDLEGQAAYWKSHYNTPAGRGTVVEYLESYRKFVL